MAMEPELAQAVSEKARAKTMGAMKAKITDIGRAGKVQIDVVVMSRWT